MENIGIDGLGKLVLQIAEKLPVTIFVAALSFMFGLALGVVIALVRIKKRPVPYAIATLYVSFMRGTPALVQLFLIFYGLPQLLLLLNIDINDWNVAIFAIITFSLHIAAFLSEAIRSSYLAVGNGQLEAAYSIGLNDFQALRLVMLPQVLNLSLPTLGNNALILLKETSVAFTIGLVDIMGQAQVYLQIHYGMNMFGVYLLISLFYWLLCLAIERGVAYMEKRYAKIHIGLSR
ncbi:amino acid ABC transporter membrane protein 1, PAAT family [Syntrophobotulus glycolicus DSM 8271]|uniref:Amino acid ABC transporter membrane protein 1, PAAT family n=1 Tax=Syntrophobotulus glycolicus (strain DSM 8271 / FlGlyR) TaxID=645991 RepID=F0SU48_SYNGF|nr:amino acid ABC transporter permease [Syntrophobotulus glycolicus]ADY55431.1 amino acid ABC transporter membrane protein 1, PAAT family [Syntrophobotulus glycolicus DSM 8271]